MEWPVELWRRIVFLFHRRQFDADLEAKIAALTPQQISDAFRRNVDVNAMTVVRGGDFKKVEVYQ